MTLPEKISARIDELEDIANAATPGPWNHVKEFDEVVSGDGLLISVIRSDSFIDTARHIAAFDPPTALALIACIRLSLRLCSSPDAPFLRSIAATLGIDAAITPTEAQIMRHALGLDQSSVSYRNYYNAPSGTDISPILDGLVSRGLMERNASDSSGYKVTKEGMATLGIREDDTARNAPLRLRAGAGNADEGKDGRA